MDIFWPALLKIVLIQLVSGAVIAAILFQLLKRQLVEFALRKLEAVDFQPDGAVHFPLIITTVGGLSKKINDRVCQMALKKTGKTASLQHVADKKIMGGVIIAFPGGILDYSLRHRLKEGGFLK